LDTDHDVKAGNSSSSSSSSSSSTYQAVQPPVQPAAGGTALQQVQAWAQEQWLRVSGGSKGPDAASRQRKQLYMELSGKDSGPDLAVDLSSQQQHRQQQQQLGTELPR
jgi:hypothetical protein